jgi:hypothetical protein
VWRTGQWGTAGEIAPDVKHRAHRVTELDATSPPRVKRAAGVESEGEMRVTRFSPLQTVGGCWQTRGSCCQARGSFCQTKGSLCQTNKRAFTICLHHKSLLNTVTTTSRVLRPVVVRSDIKAHPSSVTECFTPGSAVNDFSCTTPARRHTFYAWWSCSRPPKLSLPRHRAGACFTVDPSSPPSLSGVYLLEILLLIH